MRVLNKYEKEYIVDSVQKELTKRLPTWENVTKNVNDLLKGEAKKHKETLDVINMLKLYFSEEDIEAHLECTINDYNKYFYLKFAKNFIDLTLRFNASDDLIDKVYDIRKKYRKTNDTVYESSFYNKYYIIFNTWTAPNSDRLKKIEELVTIIVDDIIKEREAKK